WIRQSGFPQVGVALEGSALRLTQHRFFAQAGAHDGQTWPVPMILRFQDDAGVHEQPVGPSSPGQQGPLEAKGKIASVQANEHGTGFHRTAYSAQGLEQLAAHLDALNPSERAGLLSDTWAQVQSGDRPVQDLLALASRFQGERDDMVLRVLLG